MSFFKTWFRSAPPKEEEEDDAAIIARMSAQLQDLSIKRDALVRKNAQLKDKAKAAIKSGNRELAASYSQQHTMNETTIRQYSGQHANLQRQMQTMECAATTIHVASTVKSSNAAMQRMMNGLNVDDVGGIADDAIEIIDDVSHVGDALATPFGAPIDDDEIDDKLDNWAAEDDDFPSIRAKVDSNPVRREQITRRPNSSAVRRERPNNGRGIKEK